MSVRHEKTLTASERELIRQRQSIYRKKKEPIETRFGRNVRKLRRQRRMTQEDLAFICGMQQHYISDVELGKRNVSLRVVEIFARALRVNEKDLF